MTNADRGKLAFIVAGMAVAGVLVYRGFSPRETAVDSPEATSVPAAEKRLLRLRQVAASLPGKEQVMRQAETELAAREKGLIQAETASQAQAQLLQILRKVARGQSPAVDIKNVELGQPRPLGDAYGEVLVSVSMDCRIEQIVQMLADLTAQPELIATSELRLGAAQGREKMIPVRLTVSGAVARKLIPEKKGPAAF
jgi:hypothetical protein